MKFRTLALSLSLAAIAAISLTAAACGGDDNSSSSSGSSGSTSAGTGSDEQYVKDLCKAAATFDDSLKKVDPSKVKSADDAIALYVDPLDSFVNAMKKAKPPKDMKEYHDGLIKSMSDALAAIKKDKNPEALSNLGNAPEPPQAVKDRLQKLIDKNDDCKKADYTIN